LKTSFPLADLTGYIQRNPTKGIESWEASIPTSRSRGHYVCVAFTEIPERELRGAVVWPIRFAYVCMLMVAFKEIPERELRA
jgi:hypothetical protein